MKTRLYAGRKELLFGISFIMRQSCLVLFLFSKEGCSVELGCNACFFTFVLCCVFKRNAVVKAE